MQVAGAVTCYASIVWTDQAVFFATSQACYCSVVKTSVVVIIILVTNLIADRIVMQIACAITGNAIVIRANLAVSFSAFLARSYLPRRENVLTA